MSSPTIAIIMIDREMPSPSSPLYWRPTAIISPDIAKQFNDLAIRSPVIAMLMAMSRDTIACHRRDSHEYH
jgi:hypothetical protein